MRWQDIRESRVSYLCCSLSCNLSAFSQHELIRNKFAGLDFQLYILPTSSLMWIWRVLHGVVYLCQSKGNFLNVLLIVYCYESLVGCFVFPKVDNWLVWDINPVGFWLFVPVHFVLAAPFCKHFLTVWWTFWIFVVNRSLLIDLSYFFGNLCTQSSSSRRYPSSSCLYT